MGKFAVGTLENIDMEINLVTFTSPLSKHDAVLHPHEVMLNEIEKYFTVRYVYYRNIDGIAEDAFKIVFVASGGVEKLFVENFEHLTYPVVLLTDGLQNSLPAALEIAAWLRKRGMKFRIIHADPQSVVKQLITSYNTFETNKKLRSKRIGVIGTPSSWLIASSVDYLLAKRRWGVEYVDIPLEEVFLKYKRITEDEIGEAASTFAHKALACLEATPDDLLKAMRLYKAVKEVCWEYNLNAFTINCFALIELTGTTGCLALSLLNDAKMIAGCEGDLQAVFTLLATHTLTGQIGFMANPSLVSEKTNEVNLAHCTIATKLTEKYIIRSHFETQSGIAIQGILPTGDVTIVKCGGECLDEYFISSGTLVDNTNYINACRTQVRVKLNKPVNYFLNNPLGNHHILIRGNYERELNDFFQANGCRRIE